MGPFLQDNCIGVFSILNNRFANIKLMCMYGMGSTITIIEFTIWPHLSKMQLLNLAIKTRPSVHLLKKYYVNVLGIDRVGTGCKIQNEFNVINITKTNTDNC